VKFPSKYYIKDLEKLSGIKAHTIRIWEKRFGIIEPSRTDSNIRFYSNDDLRTLLNISLLNKHGIKISQISEMSEHEINEKVSSINLVKTENDDLIESLILGMIDMNEKQFDKIFSACILRMGFENTVLNVVFPFLNRIGVMWTTGSINPAQEHFVSNIIRQKIIVATESLGHTEESTSPTALLFLPDNELHEISLLFYNYALRARKYKTFYLGQAVPTSSLSRILKITKPDILVTVVYSLASDVKFRDFFALLNSISEKKKILISGHAAFENKKHLPVNAHFFSNLQELLKSI
jgi:DNA-binding transcriptional MerR regulator